MKQQIATATAVAESPGVSKDRKEIYLGEALKALLKQRPKDSLTTVVNLIAERYRGIMERHPPLVCTVREEDVYRAVLATYRRRLEANDIGLFPAAVKDWLARNPEYPRSAHDRIASAEFADLVLLIERLERDQ